MMKIIDMTKHNNKNHYNGSNPKKYKKELTKF